MGEKVFYLETGPSSWWWTQLCDPVFAEEATQGCCLYPVIIFKTSRDA